MTVENSNLQSKLAPRFSWLRYEGVAVGGTENNMSMMGDIKKAQKYATKYANDVDADDILSYLGLERRRSVAETLLGTFGILAAGAVVGAGVALFLAPSSGKKLRADVGGKLNDLRQKVLTEADSITTDVVKELKHDPKVSSYATTSNINHNQAAPFR